jgi:hypothetical protein
MYDTNSKNKNITFNHLKGGQADCSIIDPKKYKFCDNPIDELTDEQRIECDRIKGPYRYDINPNDPEMSSTKCKKNTGAISYECAKERFNTYYDLKNQTDSGRMRGKLFDVKYNKKPSLILYPGEACSSKYLHGEGVKTFDIWGVDAFPEDSCPIFSNENRVSSKCYSDNINNDLKYGPEVSRLIPDVSEKRLYNQYFTGNADNLAKARSRNWENFHKNPKIRKISPKTNDEFLEYMIERNVSQDRPVRKERVKQARRKIPHEPIFSIENDDNYEGINYPKEDLLQNSQSNTDLPLNQSINESPIVLPNVSPMSLENQSPIVLPNVSPMSLPNVSPMRVSLDDSEEIEKQKSIDLLLEDDLSAEDIESEINKVDEVLDIPEIEVDDDIDFDILFKQPQERDFNADILEYIRDGIISDFDTFANLIVIDDIVGKKRVYYLYNADNNFIYEIPLNIVALISQFDFENKIQIETFLNTYRQEIFDRLQTPYYPIGSYYGSNEFQFYE